MTTDEKIDQILSDICKSGKYCIDFKSGSHFYQNREYLNLMITTYRLLTTNIQRHLHLTSLGKKVCRKGGWLKYNKKKKRNKIIYRAITYTGILAGLFFGCVQTFHLFLNKEKTISIESEEVKPKIELQENQNQLDSIKNEQLDSLNI
ncbi:hypothetical protein ACUNWD_12355 [Sunxiuqinia sp. A32]|uniref:hypothetical protein n=1 Tax=Sunxiuqinia sp. A32 TaxID=3461496 RepID=UPI0040455967